jgi:putative phosphoesterase
VRIAVVSDIHGNLTALEAVIADLRQVTPDVVIQGGDLAGGSPRAAAVIDRIRELKWLGVYGNADEMLWAPERVSEMLQGPHLQRVRDLLLTSTIPATRRAIGEDRLAWLRSLPLRWSSESITVVHAGPADAWRSPAANATDEELERTYAPLASPCVVYGHIHQSYVRRLPTFVVVNSGSVSLSFDGDPRAAYALIEGGRVEIRRVPYDVEEEIGLLSDADDPFAASTAQTLRTGRYAPLPARQES